MGMINYFRIEESQALLHYIYPNWPDQRGMRPLMTPQEIEEWLRRYREEKYQNADIR